MALDINQLTDDEKKDIIETYKTKLANLQQEVARVKTVLEKFGVSAPISTPLFSNPNERKDEYRINWNWTLKIKYALQKLNRCVLTREIIEKIMELEPTLKREEIINSISSTISTKSTKGIIFKRYQPYAGSDYFVGLKEWFDGEDVLSQYKGD
jgi:hypothetical protein